MTTYTFNFTQTLVSGTSFYFGPEEPYYEFDFIVSGYSPPEEVDFNFGDVVYIYNILKGTSNNFIAIWADANAGLASGSFYIGSQGVFMVVKDNVLDDWYTDTHAGRGNEFLESDDIVDINIGG
jgi:hypothetical protein